MTDIQKLKEIIGRCGIAGSKVLSHEAEGEQYKDSLLHFAQRVSLYYMENILRIYVLNQMELKL